MDRRISVVVRYRDYRNLETDPETWRLTDSEVFDNHNPQQQWTYDRVYGPKSDTRQIFDRHVKEIVHSCLEGVNGTVFAYGQTASGKTFTMHGDQKRHGIIPYAVLQMFSLMEQHPDLDYLLTVSYLEIYNENILDLLSGPEGGATSIRLFDRPDGSLDIRGLTEVRIGNERGSAEVFECLTRGEKKRHTGETRMNERSSRSHTIFRIQLESRGDEDKVFSSVLHLVDLAGSEGLKRTGATGERRVEGANINRSLLSLTKVINQLSAETSSSARGGNQFVGFRESQLTRILQTSLGGNAQTIIIAAVSGAPGNYPETKSTLEFAARAKTIKNKVKVNVYQSPEEVLKAAMLQIEQLKKQLLELKGTGGGGVPKLDMIATENDQLKTQKEQILKEKLTLEEKIAEMQANIPKILQARPEQMTTPRKMKEPNRRHTTFVAGAGRGEMNGFSPVSSMAKKPLEPLGDLGLKLPAALQKKKKTVRLAPVAEDDASMEEDAGAADSGSLSPVFGPRGSSRAAQLLEQEVEALRGEKKQLQQKNAELAKTVDQLRQERESSHLSRDEEHNSLLSQLQHLQENEKAKEKTARELKTRVKWLETVNKQLEQSSAELEREVEEQKSKIYDLECALGVEKEKARERELELTRLADAETTMRNQMGRLGRDLNAAKQTTESERLRTRSVEEALEREKARKRAREESAERERPGSRKQQRLMPGTSEQVESPASSWCSPHFGAVEEDHRQQRGYAPSSSSSSRYQIRGPDHNRSPKGRDPGTSAAVLQLGREEFEKAVIAEQQALLSQAVAEKEAELSRKLAAVEREIGKEWGGKVAPLNREISALQAEKTRLEEEAEGLKRRVEEGEAAVAKRVQALEAERDDILREIGTKTAAAEKMAEEVRAKEKSRAELAEKVEGLRAEMQKLREEQERVLGEKDAAAEEIVKSCEQVSAELEAELKEQAEKISALESEVVSTQRARDAAEEESRQLREAASTASAASTDPTTVAQLQQAEAEAAKLREAEAALQAQLACYQSQIADGRAAQTRAEELERELAKTRARAGDRDALLQRLETEQEGRAKALQLAEGSRSKAERELVALRAEAETLRARNAEEVGKLQAQLLAAEQQKQTEAASEGEFVLQLQKQVAKSAQELRDLEQRLEEAGTARGKAEEQQKKLEDELEKEEKERIEVATEAEKLLEENARLEAEAEELKAQKQKWERTAEERAKMMDEREQLEQNLQTVEEQLEVIKKARDDAMDSFCSTYYILTAIEKMQSRVGPSDENGR